MGPLRRGRESGLALRHVNAESSAQDHPGAYRDRLSAYTNGSDSVESIVNTPHTLPDLQLARQTYGSGNSRVEHHEQLAESLGVTQCLPYFSKEDLARFGKGPMEGISGRLVDIKLETGKSFMGPRMKTEVAAVVDPAEADGEIARQLLSLAKRHDPTKPYDNYRRMTAAYAIFLYDPNENHPVENIADEEFADGELGDFRLVKVITSNQPYSRAAYLQFQNPIKEGEKIVGVKNGGVPEFAFMDQYVERLKKENKPVLEDAMRSDCKKHNVNFDDVIDHMVVHLGREWNRETGNDDKLPQKDEISGKLKDLVDKWGVNFYINLSETMWDWKPALIMYAGLLDTGLQELAKTEKRNGVTDKTKHANSILRHNFVNYMSALDAFRLMMHDTRMISDETGTKFENPLKWTIEMVTDEDRLIAADIVNTPLPQSDISKPSKEKGKFYSQKALQDVDLLITATGGNALMVANVIGEDRTGTGLHAYTSGDGVSFDGSRGAFPDQGLDEFYGHGDGPNLTKGIAARFSGATVHPGNELQESTARYVVIDLLQAKGKLLFQLAAMGFVEYPDMPIDNKILWSDLYRKRNVDPIPTLIAIDPDTDKPKVLEVMLPNTALEIVSSPDGLKSYHRPLMEIFYKRGKQVVQAIGGSAARGNRPNDSVIKPIIKDNDIKKNETTLAGITFVDNALHVWKAPTAPSDVVKVMPSEKRFRRPKIVGERHKIR